jgi:hypothetical protein
MFQLGIRPANSRAAPTPAEQKIPHVLRLPIQLAGALVGTVGGCVPDAARRLSR